MKTAVSDWTSHFQSPITKCYAGFLQQSCWPKALIRVQHVCDTVQYRDESSQCKDFILRSGYEKASKRPPSETDSLTALFEVYSSSLTQPAFINTNTVAVLKRRSSPDSFSPCCFSWYTLLGIALLKPNNYFKVIKRKKWIMTLGTLETS